MLLLLLSLLGDWSSFSFFGDFSVGTWCFSRKGLNYSSIRRSKILGKCFLTKPETIWPLVPWPSHTPKSHRPSTPARSFTHTNASWLGLGWFGINPCLKVIPKFSTMLWFGFYFIHSLLSSLATLGTSDELWSAILDGSISDLVICSFYY